MLPIPKEDLSEESTLKNLIKALQKQIKVLEDRIAKLETALYETTDGDMAEIITRTEPPILPTLVPPTNQQQESDYHIRIVNDTPSSFGIGDLIHFEAKAPPCPEPIYGLDGTTVANKEGRTGIYIHNQEGLVKIVSRNVCNSDTWETWVYTMANAARGDEQKNYLTSFNVSDDHAMLSGTWEVSGAMMAGDYYLELSVSRDGAYHYYYTDTFTLG